jgi:CheY-like chemotaxis protein
MSISALIIDDEKLAREELQYLLDSVGGVEVLAQGANGIEAVNLIEEYHPDLVFLDVQMPGLDGFAVIQRLVERSRLRNGGKEAGLPQIVFATAYDQYAVRAFDVNAVDYLLKPFDRTRVSAAVERARVRMASQADELSVDDDDPADPAASSTTPRPASPLPRPLSPPSSSSRPRTVFFSSIRPASASPPSTKASSASSPATSRASPSAAPLKSCRSCSIPPTSGARIAALSSTSTTSAKSSPGSSPVTSSS